VRADGLMHIARDVLRCRHLLWSLAWRDIRVRYKQSLLGIAWAVVLPVSMMVIFTFVFTRAIDARAALGVEVPYALYAFTGLVPWTFFSTSLQGCVQSLVANRNLVTKVYFPREVFPLSCIVSALVDFGIALAVLGVMIAYYRHGASWYGGGWARLAWMPVVIGVQIVLTAGLGLLLAMGNLFYRDVRQLFSVGIQLWMFISAVVVPLPRDGSLLAHVLAANPLVPLIGAYRDCLLHNRTPDMAGLAYAAAFALGTLLASGTVFRRASYRFAECI